MCAKGKLEDSIDSMKKKVDKASSKPEDTKDSMAEKQFESEAEFKDMHKSM